MAAGTGTVTSELLWLHASWVGDEETLVVLNEHLLKLTLLGLVLVLLVEGNDGLSDGKADGHDLGGGTTAADAHADVHVLELVAAEEEDWLEGLESERAWLQQVEWLVVDLDEASAWGGVGNSGGVLLAAEALHGFGFTHLSLL